MRRYELVGRRDIRLRTEVAVPGPGPLEVLVRVRACTVCNRSDLAYFHYHGLREHCSQGCFGHEVAGVVEATGAGVSRVVPGQRVFVRTPLTTGYADFALAREIAVGVLPDSVPFEQGAILQLLPLAVHATRGVRLGDRVVIVGQGPVGQLALRVAVARGAAEVVAVDLDDWRLERSAAAGADSVRRVDGGSEQLASVGADFDVAIDAVGTPTTLNACVGLVRQNGLVVMLGTHHIDTRVSVDLVTWERKGLRVHSSAEPLDTARAEALAVAERLAHRRPDALRLPDLLTHTYPLEELPKAMERLSASSALYPDAESAPYDGPPRETLKVAIVP
ncbi:MULTISPECIES: zinc-dependent alcohol dehydrogenase [unclassified Streptomyces]|uniref:zinc-dependent alcohol dehydrogenase n=1 Tax=unclassified Streptomyces TaxID=2593676 RepID=UPI00074A3F5E|nr:MULTISPECIES: zinc-binding dehydrogenase [unclassified Streptomyces]KUL48092.1 sorbitol dehydrogenase [Streptomyces sp. NRRL S-1521]THC51387.1 sorbitol dehydrogenase [Streptomyces sp. A1499]